MFRVIQAVRPTVVRRRMGLRASYAASGCLTSDHYPGLGLCQVAPGKVDVASSQRRPTFSLSLSPKNLF